MPARAEAPVGAPTPATSSASRLADLYRGVFGVLLVLGAALLFLSLNDIFGGLRDAALTTVVAVVALGLILAPFLWRLGRNLAAVLLLLPRAVFANVVRSLPDHLQRLWLAEAPTALPYAFSGAKVAVTVSVIGAVFAEYVGSSDGLGHLINQAQAQLLTARSFAAVVVLSAMALGLFALVSLLERRVVGWDSRGVTRS